MSPRNYGLSSRRDVARGKATISPALSSRGGTRELQNHDALLRERVAAWFAISFFLLFFAVPIGLLISAAFLLVDLDGVREGMLRVFDFG